MKKSIYLLFALFMLSMVSCNYATNAKGKTMTDDPVAKENKSLVQEKKYVSNKEYWSVSLTNRLEDTRTKEDLMINAPKKICIVNRVIFNGLSMVSSKSLKGIPYTQYCCIKKTIKEDTGEINFILNAKICTFNAIKLSNIPPLKILFSDKQHVLAIDDVEIIYQETDEPQYGGGSGGKSSIKDTIISANISLDIINQLRAAKSDITIKLKTIDNDSFEIIFPPIFIEYLKEI